LSLCFGLSDSRRVAFEFALRCESILVSCLDSLFGNPLALRLSLGNTLSIAVDLPLHCRGIILSRLVLFLFGISWPLRVGLGLWLVVGFLIGGGFLLPQHCKAQPLGFGLLGACLLSGFLLGGVGSLLLEISLLFLQGC